jgi:hypothetical protein
MTEEKKCSGCGQTKSIDCFSVDLSNSTGYQHECKDCRKKRSYFDPNLDPTTTKKKCTGECKEEKFLTEFNRSDKGRFGYANECKSCRNCKRRQNTNLNPSTKGTKVCNGSLCNGKEHSKTQFNKDKYSQDGLQSVCRDCQLNKTNATYSKLDSFIAKILNDCRSRAKKKTKKGRDMQCTITKEDVLELYKTQDGKCAITKLVMTHNALNDRKEEDCHILNPLNISIDRINSGGHYEKTNIRLVCAIINRIRFDLPDEKFYDICEKIAKADNIKAKKVKDIDDIIESKDFLKYVEYKLTTAKHNANARELDFDLDEDDIIELYKKQKGICSITKEKLSYEKSSSLALSFDRIKCDKGYHRDNVMLVIEPANKIRSDLPIDELKKYCRTIVDNK